LLNAFNTVDRLLNRRIEVLHTEARPIEPDLGGRGDIARLDQTGVGLDREIAQRRAAEVKLPPEAVDQVGDLSRAQDVRCAAAEVQLNHFAVAIEEPRDFLRFAQQPLEIGTAASEVARDYDCASA